jgi:ubiquinone/menaquinone biosynthesis C-methylase UbiE
MEDFALALGGRVPVAENPSGSEALLAGPHFPRDFAARLAAYETLIDEPPTQQLGEPFSLQWFLDVEKQRLSRQGRWIPRVLEFGKHSGERLLGLGHGLGTDWVQYAQKGAQVVVCTPSPMQLQLVRRNFEVRDLSGRFVSADPTRLPLDSNSVDVACLSSLYHGIDHPEAVIDEVFRVLKPGGKVLAVTSARFDVDFWFDTLFFGYRFLAGERRTQRKPGPEHLYSGRQLCRLFGRFCEHRVYKRQLRHSEVPYVWRFVPTSILARFMGRVLVLKAFKPVKGDA